MAVRPFTPRAHRYAVPIAVRYRSAGETTWREGRTENISKSGVLVRTDRVIAPQTAIELLLDVPPDISTPFYGATRCRGRVVRAVGPSPLANGPAFAAAIFECETTRLVDPRRI
jgi:hypothetical protein